MKEFFRFWRLWRRLGKALWELLIYMHSFHQDSHRKGKRWEEDFFSECERRGLHVADSRGREDGIVNGLKVQCKAVDMVRNGTADIANMRPVIKNGGMRGYLRREVDIIALRSGDETYLIHADFLVRDDGTLRGRVRLTEIQHFKDNWSVFDTGYTPPPISRQLTLL